MLFSPGVKIPSSSDIWEFVTNLSIKLNFQDLICASNFAPIPAGVTAIVVFDWLYPIPPYITLTSTKDPFDNMGVNNAPAPVPSIWRFGGELYPSPGLLTKTSTICPFEIIGVNWIPDPEFNSKSGCLL